MDNDHDPATKLDLRELELRLRQMEEQLRSEFQHGFDDLKEAMRDGHTKLLKAFYNFTSSNHERFAHIETDEAALVKRLGVLENRVTELERKINFPNQ